MTARTPRQVRDDLAALSALLGRIGDSYDALYPTAFEGRVRGQRSRRASVADPTVGAVLGGAPARSKLERASQRVTAAKVAAADALAALLELGDLIDQDAPAETSGPRLVSIDELRQAREAQARRRQRRGSA